MNIFQIDSDLDDIQGIDFTVSTAASLMGTRRDVAVLEPIKFFFFLEACNYQAGLVRVSVVIEKAVDFVFFLLQA